MWHSCVGSWELLWFWLIRCGVCCYVVLLEVISGVLVLGASWCPDEVCLIGGVVYDLGR